jgi:hypothetical protein
LDRFVAVIRLGEFALKNAEEEPLSDNRDAPAGTPVPRFGFAPDAPHCDSQS